MEKNKEQILLDEIMATADEQNLTLLYSQVVRGSELVAENNKVKAKHRMHVFSIGKSLTACAVGIAEGEGLIALDDVALDYFPEYKEKIGGDEKYRFTIKDLLMMSIGLEKALFFSTDEERYKEKDWVDYFWNAGFDLSRKGEFKYSNFCSYILSCIIEKVSGESMLEYLRYRFFERIGIENPDWTYCPKGHTYACNGIFLNIDEMSNFGSLLLNLGKYNGEQVVPERFIKDAISKQVETVGSPFGPRFEYGYGYGIWMTEIPGTFMCYGSCGQFLLGIPDRNILLSFVTFEPNEHLKLLDIIMDKTKDYLK